MSVIPIVFLGTPDFAVHHLEGLLGDEHFEVVAVVSQPDRPSGRRMKLQPSPVKQLALQRDLPVLTPEKMGTKELSALKDFRAEGAVVVAFGQILSREFLDLYPRRVVNVHASLLPRWRGAAPIQRAIMAGDPETGVSLQVMVPKLDAGDVLGVRRLKLDDEINSIELHEKLKPLGVDLLHLEFMDYLRGHLTPSPQNEAEVTYAKKILKSEAPLDWSLTARELHNRVRGLRMGPGSHTFRDGKKLKILRTQVVPRGAGGTPGCVMDQDDVSFLVACGKDCLRVLEVQPESKGPMPVGEYLRGYRIKTGGLLS